MRRRLLLFGLFGLLGLAGVFAVSGSSAASPAWGTAIEVPGTATLNSGGSADVLSVSCATAGNCAGGGKYVDGRGAGEAFVVDETNGVWGTAIEVPGTEALNSAFSAEVLSVSCATAGNCAAGGFYHDGSGRKQSFVVDERSGTWGTAIEVPGTATLNSGGFGTGVTSVSCATDGNCAAVGSYRDGSGSIQAFVADETNGSWGTAVEVPGTATLNSGGDAYVSSVSCATAGNCTAGGYYQDGSVHTQAFVVGETNGSWGTAIEVPGTATLNTGGGFASVNSVSCATAGNCVAGGQYYDGSSRAFVVNETNGSWGTVIEVPGTATPNSGGGALVQSVSCATAGNCAGGGSFTDGSGSTQAFVVDETNGSWGTAIEVPGSAPLNSDHQAGVVSVSCATSGNCAAGGDYRQGPAGFDSNQTFVATETNGTWGTAIEVPGTATLNSGDDALLESISCASASDCAAGGQYTDGSGRGQAFVASSTPTPLGTTRLAAAAAGGVYRGTTTLSATLTSGGNGVSGETVSFSLNGTSVGSATTDGNGVAALPNVSLSGIQAGSYPTAVGASFDGDGNPQSASSGSSSLTVYRAGLVGLSGVSVQTSAGKIDSFDSSRGPYNATSNHGSAALVMSNGPLGLAGVSLFGSATSTQGAVTVASTAHVSGNVRAGTTASITGTVSGTVTQNSPSTALSRPTVSACSPFSAKTGISGGTFSYSASTGDLTVKSGTVKLANGTYCFHTIALAAGAQLAVSGPVRIHLTGQITGASGHIVNNTNNPANLHIDTSYTGTAGVMLPGGSHAYMTILAPATSVTIPSGSFFGTLLAGTVSLTGGAAFHADTH